MLEVGGGETGIRTLGTRESTTVFETAPFDHSGISPRRHLSMPQVLKARRLAERCAIAKALLRPQALQNACISLTRRGLAACFAQVNAHILKPWIALSSSPAKRAAQSTHRARPAADLALVRWFATDCLTFAAWFSTLILSLRTAKNGMNPFRKKSDLPEISRFITCSQRTRNRAMLPMSVKAT